MITIFFALVIGVIMTSLVLWAGDLLNSGLVFVAGVVLALAVGTSSIVYAHLGWNWFAAEHQARIINREYGTNYTQEEVFYAGSVIDTIRQLDRKRVELNGNLVTGE